MGNLQTNRQEDSQATRQANLQQNQALATTPRKRGILLVAHGSVVAGAEQDLQRVAAFLRAKIGGGVVELGYLSGTSPSLADAVDACVAQGVTDLLVMPYFLSGGYLQRKALRQVELEAQRHPHLTLHQGAPLGPHPRFADVVLDRIAEALAGR